MSGPGPESSHGGMIDKETKTKEGRYLDGECLHTNKVPSGDGARLNAAKVCVNALRSALRLSEPAGS